MKKLAWIAIVMSFLFVVLGAEPSNAKPSAPLWTCQILGQMKDNGFSVILGIVNITGDAQIRCVTATGQKLKMQRVRLEIRGVSVGPDISFPDGDSVGMRVRSLEFGLSSLSSIYGEYSVIAGASARLGHARATASGKLISFTPFFHKPGISGGVLLAMEHSGQFGLGVNVSLSTLRIKPLQ